jgi:hypothetical protein
MIRPIHLDVHIPPTRNLALGEPTSCRNLGTRHGPHASEADPQICDRVVLILSLYAPKNRVVLPVPVGGQRTRVSAMSRPTRSIAV